MTSPEATTPRGGSGSLNPYGTQDRGRRPSNPSVPAQAAAQLRDQQRRTSKTAFPRMASSSSGMRVSARRRSSTAPLEQLGERPVKILKEQGKPVLPVQIQSHYDEVLSKTPEEVLRFFGPLVAIRLHAGKTRDRAILEVAEIYDELKKINETKAGGKDENVDTIIFESLMTALQDHSEERVRALSDFEDSFLYQEVVAGIQEDDELVDNVNAIYNRLAFADTHYREATPSTLAKLKRWWGETIETDAPLSPEIEAIKEATEYEKGYLRDTIRLYILHHQGKNRPKSKLPMADQDRRNASARREMIDGRLIKNKQLPGVVVREKVNGDTTFDETIILAELFCNFKTFWEGITECGAESGSVFNGALNLEDCIGAVYDCMVHERKELQKNTKFGEESLECFMGEVMYQHHEYAPYDQMTEILAHIDLYLELPGANGKKVGEVGCLPISQANLPDVVRKIIDNPAYKDEDLDIDSLPPMERFVLKHKLMNDQIKAEGKTYRTDAQLFGGILGAYYSAYNVAVQLRHVSRPRTILMGTAQQVVRFPGEALENAGIAPPQAAGRRDAETQTFTPPPLKRGNSFETGVAAISGANKLIRQRKREGKPSLATLANLPGIARHWKSYTRLPDVTPTDNPNLREGIREAIHAGGDEDVLIDRIMTLYNAHQGKSETTTREDSGTQTLPPIAGSSTEHPTPAPSATPSRNTSPEPLQLPSIPSLPRQESAAERLASKAIDAQVKAASSEMDALVDITNAPSLRDKIRDRDILAENLLELYDILNLHFVPDVKEDKYARCYVEVPDGKGGTSRYEMESQRQWTRLLTSRRKAMRFILDPQAPKPKKDEVEKNIKHESLHGPITGLDNLVTQKLATALTPDNAVKRAGGIEQCLQVLRRGGNLAINVGDLRNRIKDFKVLRYHVHVNYLRTPNAYWARKAREISNLNSVFLTQLSNALRTLCHVEAPPPLGELALNPNPDYTSLFGRVPRHRLAGRAVSALVAENALLHSRVRALANTARGRVPRPPTGSNENPRGPRVNKLQRQNRGGAQHSEDGDFPPPGSPGASYASVLAHGSPKLGSNGGSPPRRTLLDPIEGDD